MNRIIVSRARSINKGRKRGVCGRVRVKKSKMLGISSVVPQQPIRTKRVEINQSKPREQHTSPQKVGKGGPISTNPGVC